MTSTRCGSCGLVNWQEETACKRCGTALGVAEPYRTTGYSGLRTPQQTDVPLWSGGVKGLGIVAAVSLLTTVIRGVSGPGLSLLVGMPEMLVGSFAMLAGVLMLYPPGSG